jgi:hypothetical protein
VSGYIDSSSTDSEPLHDPADLREPLTETRRIMRTGTVWVAAGALAPAIGLGPLLASGFRPAQLPAALGLAFWIGIVAAGVGLALLIWAACPVPAFPLEQAHPQKVFSIRVGIVLNIAGMALVGITMLLSPVPGAGG